MVGTDFQQQVWRILLKIPDGKIWRYKFEAEILGKPNAVRAVANANGCNKISPKLAVENRCPPYANQGQIFCASHQGIPQPVFALNLNNYQEST
jgi:hypothetical protein